MNLNLASGSHTLLANSVHPSGRFTATASSTFTVTAPAADRSGPVTNAYDGDGNVITRTWANGTTQTLSWDALGRLVKVVQRNGANTGFDWTAVYDGLGRRLKTGQQTVTSGSVDGALTVTTSIYDPQVEFLEIGVAVNGAKAWKVYGPDLNGSFGSLQGTGGLEATIRDADRAPTGVVGDHFGNGVAAVSGGSLGWFATRAGSYGPLPGSGVQTLTEVSKLAESTAWRGRRVDATGFIFLGARYYEPNSGRFLSADPMGHGASMSLYDYCNGDPVNCFDPDGREGKKSDVPSGPFERSGAGLGGGTPAGRAIWNEVMGITPQQDAAMQRRDNDRMNQISEKITETYVSAALAPVSAPAKLAEKAGSVGAWAIWKALKKAVGSIITETVAPTTPDGTTPQKPPDGTKKGCR